MIGRYRKECKDSGIHNGGSEKERKSYTEVAEVGARRARRKRGRAASGSVRAGVLFCIDEGERKERKDLVKRPVAPRLPFSVRPDAEEERERKSYTEGTEVGAQRARRECGGRASGTEWPHPSMRSALSSSTRI